MFSLKVGSQRRVVLKIIERANFDLIVVTKGPKYHNDSIKLDGVQKGYVQDKFSIHNSDITDKPINVIKREMVFEDRSTEHMLHYTKGIKRDNQFVPILLRRVPNLSSDRYASKGSYEEETDLGEYEPQRFSLYYMLLVSDAKREFNFPPQQDFARIDKVFSRFRITLMLSFACAPADSSGGMLVFTTMKQEDAPPEFSGLIKVAESGRNESEVVNLFRTLRAGLYQAHMQMLEEKFSTTDYAAWLRCKAYADIAGFLPAGSKENNPVYAERIKAISELKAIIYDPDLGGIGLR